MSARQGFCRLIGAFIALAGAISVTEAYAQTSTEIIVESVNNYGGGTNCNNPPNLCNSIANGDGFLQGMTFPGSRYRPGARWVDGAVYDSDFADPAVNSQGADRFYFDQSSRAISYFTGHGIVDHGCSTVRCTSTSQCTRPDTATGPGVPRLPGTCRFSPFDRPRCCYMVDRQAVTFGTFDKFGRTVNYTGGPIRWGESPQSGSWAGAGTDGGANLVVLDISHGVLPPFWYQTFRQANAGVQLIATMMTAGGDTSNVAERGKTFATFFKTNENSRVSEAWVQTMNALPAGLGQGCPGGGGGHGFNGCGCNLIVGMDHTPQRAQASLAEGWVNLTNDSNDAFGNQFFAARWVCNYPLPSTTRSAWELP
jgi:hypothetical protein